MRNATRGLVLAALICTPAFAQTAPAPTPPLPAPTPLPRVTLQTAEGPIVIALEAEKAPLSTANFLKYVAAKRLDGSSFYRVVRPAPGFGFIQGGIQNDPKKVLPPIAHEPTTKTGLTHADGTISLARLAPGSARGEFFITVGDIASMDADPKQPGDNLGYAAFGHVVEGMAIVRHILDEPVSPTAGVGALRGQMLAAPIRILTARRTN